MKILLIGALALSGCTLAASDKGNKGSDGPAPRDPPAAPVFDFNLLAFGDVDLTRSAAQGRLAARGDVTLSGFSVGGVLAEDEKRCDLIAGGDLTFTDGTVAKGALCVGGSLHTTRVGTKYPGKNAASIDFAGLAAAAGSYAAGFAALPAVTTVDERTLNGARGRVVLEGKDPKLDVFALSAGAAALASTLVVRVPAGATAVINVAGTAVELADMGVVAEAGAQAAKILLNLPEAQTLAIDGVSILGTILAPKAAVAFNNGTIGGGIIAAGAEGDGRYNSEPFSGNLP